MVKSLLTTLEEVRNKIYDFAREERSIPLKRLYSMRYHKWTAADHRLRQFKGLTQVCRKIRDEFLPLYNQRTSVSVPAHEVEFYLKKVLRAGSIQDTQLKGSVTGFLQGSIFAVDIDVLPLMRTVASAERLYLRFDTDIHDSIAMWATELLRLATSTQAVDAIEHTMSQIRIRHNGWGTLGVWIKIENDMWEEWMKGWNMVDCYPDRIEEPLFSFVKHWALRVGLPRVDDVAPHISFFRTELELDELSED